MTNRTNAAFDTSGVFSPDRLVINSDRLLDRSITLISGQDLARGAVLGIITASGKYTLCDTSASDGSEDPVAILAEATDASGGDATTIAYERGDFDENEITLGGSDTVADVREALRDVGIFLLPSTTA